jgi:hypothetical protein
VFDKDREDERCFLDNTSLNHSLLVWSASSGISLWWLEDKGGITGGGCVLVAGGVAWVCSFSSAAFAFRCVVCVCYW